MSGYRHNNRRKSNRGTGIPDRWLNYDPVGRDIEGTRFVPFKTPLDSRFFENGDLHPDDYFDVRTIIGFAREAGKQIGLVIDLTNTDRYYNKQEWKDYDVEYIKINCPGHEVDGREDIVEKFIEHVDTFIDKNNNDSLIGVHCTHGLNRTGYLICRYLIDRLGWTAERAISQFEYNRGHPIERGHYKRTLYEAFRRKLQGPSISESPEKTESSNGTGENPEKEAAEGDQDVSGSTAESSVGDDSNQADDAVIAGEEPPRSDVIPK